MLGARCALHPVPIHGVLAGTVLLDVVLLVAVSDLVERCRESMEETVWISLVLGIKREEIMVRLTC